MWCGQQMYHAAIHRITNTRLSVQKNITAHLAEQISSFHCELKNETLTASNKYKYLYSIFNF
jgi:hypothetical protein